MSPLSTNDLQRIFEKLDQNGDGLVSLDELNWLLEKIGVQFTLDELESLVGKPTLNMNEFMFFYDSISNETLEDIENEDELLQGDHHQNPNGSVVANPESDLAKAFQVFDLDGDGFITSEELQSVLARLGLWDGRKDCKTMICVYDTNLDGVLDFEEFKTMMLQTIS